MSFVAKTLHKKALMSTFLQKRHNIDPLIDNQKKELLLIYTFR